MQINNPVIRRGGYTLTSLDDTFDNSAIIHFYGAGTIKMFKRIKQTAILKYKAHGAEIIIALDNSSLKVYKFPATLISTFRY